MANNDFTMIPTLDAKKFFDGIGYFRDLAQKNKLAKEHHFFPCTCSGISSLEGVLANFRREQAFICVEDTNDSTTEENSGGFFSRRAFTVFIMARYRYDDMDDREQKLNICRQIFRQFHSRMLMDREHLSQELAYLNVERVSSREFGQYFINGCTGLYFMVDLSEPINLEYNAEEWEG